MLCMDNTSLLPIGLLLDKNPFLITSAKEVMFEAVSVCRLFGQQKYCA